MTDALSMRPPTKEVRGVKRGKAAGTVVIAIFTVNRSGGREKRRARELGVNSFLHDEHRVTMWSGLGVFPMKSDRWPLSGWGHWRSAARAAHLRGRPRNRHAAGVPCTLSVPSLPLALVCALATAVLDV